MGTSRRYLMNKRQVIEPADVQGGRWGKFAGSWAFIVSVRLSDDEEDDGGRVILSDWMGLKTRVCTVNQITHVAERRP